MEGIERNALLANPCELPYRFEDAETVSHLFGLFLDHLIVQLLGQLNDLGPVRLSFYPLDDLFPWVDGHRKLFPTGSAALLNTVRQLLAVREIAPKLFGSLQMTEARRIILNAQLI